MESDRPAARGHEIPEVPIEREEGPEGWVVLREVQDLVQAELITGLLRSGGIDAQVENRIFTQEPVPLVRSFSRVLIWVPQADLAQAEQVLEDSEAHPATDADVEEQDTQG